MSTTTYLNPTIITLDALDFVKMDIAPGSAKLVDVTFAIAGYGSLATLSSTIDRVAKTCTKACGAALALTTAQPVLTQEDSQGATPAYPYGAILAPASYYHSDFVGTGLAPATLLKSALFNHMVRNIFDLGTDNMEQDNLNFTVEDVRTNQDFFYSFDSNDIAADVLVKTKAELDSDPSEWDDECEYWNYRTEETNPPEELSTVPFEANDKIWCVYDLTSTFTYAVSDEGPTLGIDVNNLDAISQVGTQVASTDSPFQAASVNMKFALEWKILA